MDTNQKWMLATLGAIGCTALAMGFLSNYSFYAATLMPVIMPILAGLLVGLPSTKAKKGKLLKFPLPNAAKEKKAA